MSLGIRVAVVSAVALLAVGCGGAKLDKEAAARIAMGSGQTSNSATSQGGVLRALQSGNFEGGASVSCSKGGTATMNITGMELGDGLSFSFEMTFDECTEPMWDDPETEEVEQEEVTQDGTLTMTMLASGTETGSEVSMQMKGRLELTGAVRDFVEMDVTQTMRMSFTDTSLSMTSVINGSITTSEGTHTYDNETYRLTAEGELVRDGEA